MVRRNGYGNNKTPEGHKLTTANEIIEDNTSDYLDYHHLDNQEKYRPTWTFYFATELLQLNQCVVEQVKGTYTIFLIPRTSITEDRRKYITYDQIDV